MELLLTATILLVLLLLSIIFFLFNKIERIQNTVSRIEYHLYNKNNADCQEVDNSAAATTETYPEVKKAEPVVYKAILLPQEQNKNSTPWNKFWNWLSVGENFRPDNVAPEYAVVTTWLIRCGVLLLLVGAGFLLKYSFDRKMFSPALRIGISYFAGTAAAAAGHFFARGKYRKLNLTISGGGFALMFFTSFAAYSFYGMFGIKTISILTIATVLASIACSWHRNSPVTAFVGGLGGYIAPVFLAADLPVPYPFICYFALLNSGLAFTAFRKNWPSLRCLLAVGYAYPIVYLFSKYECGQTGLYSYWLLGLSGINYLLCTLPFWNRSDLDKVEYYLWSIANVNFFIFSLLFANHIDQSGILAACNSILAVLINLLVFRFCPDKKNKFCFLAFAILALVCAEEFALRKYFWHSTVLSLTALSSALMAKYFYTKLFTASSLVLFIYAVLTFTEPADSGYLIELRYNLLTYGTFAVSLLIAASFIKKNQCREKYEWMSVVSNVMFIVGGAMLFIYLSCEIYEFLENYLPSFRLGGVSVLWSIIALVLTLTGIKKALPVLRHLGGLLFALTCFKVTLIDLSGLDSLWRITALISVGILMIIAAVMYIRKKDLFTIDK